MRSRFLFLSLIVAGAFAIPARAFMISPPSVSINRLIKNTRQYLRAHPKSADAHYTLARLHYFAFATGCATVEIAQTESADKLIDFEYNQIESIATRRPLTTEELEARREARAVELADEELHLEPAYPYKQKRPADEKAEKAAIDRWVKKLQQENWTPATSLPIHEMVEHATAAIDELHAALKLSPENPRYLLMLASLTEDVATWCELRALNPVPKPLQSLTYEEAKATFLWAFRAAKARDPKLTFGSDAAIVAHEAGDGYLRLAHGKADPPPSDVDSTRTVGEVDSGMKGMDEQAKAANKSDDEVVTLVTPIVFSLNPNARLDDLLAPDVAVDFDLRGYGPRQRWPWVRATTGFLVWDPLHTGRITSGQQLFGGYTFQLFRRDGYDALAALDDNGDGVLSGAELRGIRVWFDRNGNGRCEPGEVVDLDTLGITAIVVHATARDGRSPMNPAGLRLNDGHVLATWDWTTTPVE